MEEKTKTTTTTKITVTKQAEQMLDEMLTKANDGFSGGELSRQDLASWIIRYFHGEAFGQCAEQIRTDHFDQLAHLEALLRQAKQARKAGADAAEVAAILSAGSTGARAPVTRRTRRSDATENPVA